MTSATPSDAYAQHQAWLAGFRARQAASLEHYRASLEALAVRQQARRLMEEPSKMALSDCELTYATVTVATAHA